MAAAITAGAVASGFEHYALYGQFERRDPSPLFSEAGYLARYPDVAAAVRAGVFSSGFAHFLWFGRQEGRTP